MLTQLQGSIPPQVAARPLRVMVVDDDDDARETLQRMLGALGCPSIAAASGAEAWALHGAEPVEVILSDWQMPGMSGIELCRLVRANDPSTYTYFVFMTGFTDRKHFLEGMRAGADDYLTKPIDLGELEVRMRAAARVVSVQRDLTLRNDVLQAESEISFRVARVDALTGSANRLKLTEDMAVIASTPLSPPTCVAMCDVDRFKRYNDEHGHIAGDRALRRIAAGIRAGLRRGDQLYRYGGEEFVVVLADQTLAQSRPAMDRVRADVESLAIRGSADAPVVTLSIGLAERRATDASPDHWLRRADAALYRAKHAGRNRVETDDGVG